MLATTPWPAGSSPRVRGRRRDLAVEHHLHGLIPAGAGQTTGLSRSTPAPRAHPRGCGADTTSRPGVQPNGGSSPRVRGRRAAHGEDQERLRLIPAGAGQTLSRDAAPNTSQAHPRGCGADFERQDDAIEAVGSSPRVRGRHPGQSVPATPGWAHPRGCGADLSSYSGIPSSWGSSPRVRGRRTSAT